MQKIVINDLPSFRLPFAMDKTQFCGLLTSLKYTVKLIVDGEVEKNVSNLGNLHIYTLLSNNFMNWFNVGSLVISNIDAILKNDEETFSTLFKEIVAQFIGAISIILITFFAIGNFSNVIFEN